MHLFPQASISAYPRYFFLPITRYFCRCCLWPVASLPSPLSSSETALWKPPWSLRHQLPWACLSVLPALPFLSLLQHLTLQMAPIFSRLPSSSLCRLFLFSFWVFLLSLNFESAGCYFVLFSLSSLFLDNLIPVHVSASNFISYVHFHERKTVLSLGARNTLAQPSCLANSYWIWKMQIKTVYYF